MRNLKHEKRSKAVALLIIPCWVDVPQPEGIKARSTCVQCLPRDCLAQIAKSAAGAATRRLNPRDPGDRCKPSGSVSQTAPCLESCSNNRLGSRSTSPYDEMPSCEVWPPRAGGEVLSAGRAGELAVTVNGRNQPKDLAGMSVSDAVKALLRRAPPLTAPSTLTALPLLDGVCWGW